MGEAWKRIVASGAVDRPNPRCADPAPAGLVEGIRLFNAGEYFECHEVLEDIWRDERDPIRYLYQGILQIGVGLHHLRNSNYRGATLLLRDGIDKTSRFTPACMGVDTRSLCDRAQACLDLLQSLGRERIAGFDWSIVPVISATWDADGTTLESD
jgi:predicted metal-dependent hydrolase